MQEPQTPRPLEEDPKLREESAPAGASVFIYLFSILYIHIYIYAHTCINNGVMHCMVYGIAIAASIHTDTNSVILILNIFLFCIYLPSVLCTAFVNSSSLYSFDLCIR